MTLRTDEQNDYLIRFLHPAKILSVLPGAPSVLDDRLIADLFGVSMASYRSINAELVAAARLAAAELLVDPSFGALVNTLPFAPGSTIVGFGDSITDDIPSWLEILRHVLAMRRGADGIRIVNAGMSGDTTSQMVNRALDVLAHKPDWIICLCGSNDVRRSRVLPDECLVSYTETAKNLYLMRAMAAAAGNARWLWVTPPPVIEELVAAHWWYLETQIMYCNADVHLIAEHIRQQPDPVVDTWSVFGYPARPELLLSDGLHPNVAGHRAIARAVVERLSSRSAMSTGAPGWPKQ